MSLPKSSELDLPIKNLELKGPYIDFLNSRKESNFEISEPENFDEELQKNWEKLGSQIITGTKRILEMPL